MRYGRYHLAEQLKLSDSELGERVLRSEHRLPATAGFELATAATRKRKPLTPEQLEERRKKVSTCILELEFTDIKITFVI